MPHSSCFESFADDEDWHEDEDFDDGDIQQINVDFDDLIWFVNFNIYFWCNIVEVVLFLMLMLCYKLLTSCELELLCFIGCWDLRDLIHMDYVYFD